MSLHLQPALENDTVMLCPLQQADFEALYAAASDPEVWAQHPNRDRWKRDVFRNYFDGAMQSGGAFRVVYKNTGEVIGSTRFYDYNEAGKSLFIGYTFYARAYWGRGINPAVKGLMLDYAFGFVETVYFHIGAENLRSQIAITRLGARKVAERQVAYFGEPDRLNFEYVITREDWLQPGRRKREGV